MISSGTGMTTLLRPIPLQYNMRLHIQILGSIKWNKRHLSVVISLYLVPCAVVIHIWSLIYVTPGHIGLYYVFYHIGQIGLVTLVVIR